MGGIWREREGRRDLKGAGEREGGKMADTGKEMEGRREGRRSKKGRKDGGRDGRRRKEGDERKEGGRWLAPAE